MMHTMHPKSNCASIFIPYEAQGAFYNVHGRAEQLNFAIDLKLTNR
jgi:hypothetical protein